MPDVAVKRNKSAAVSLALVKAVECFGGKLAVWVLRGLVRVPAAL